MLVVATRNALYVQPYPYRSWSHLLLTISSATVSVAPVMGPRPELYLEGCCARLCDVRCAKNGR